VLIDGRAPIPEVGRRIREALGLRRGAARV
jgi:hypothetical protein